MNPPSAAEQYPGTWLIAAEREMNRDSWVACVMITGDASTYFVRITYTPSQSAAGNTASYSLQRWM